MPARAPSKDELYAYVEWLFMEHRLLCYELWPDSLERDAAKDIQDAALPLQQAYRFSPVGTAAGHFHFPKDGRTWKDVPTPSTRCLAVFEAIGLDASNSKWMSELETQAALPERPAS